MISQMGASIPEFGSKNCMKIKEAGLPPLPTDQPKKTIVYVSIYVSKYNFSKNLIVKLRIICQLTR